MSTTVKSKKREKDDILMVREPLTREQVKMAIERKGCEGIPTIMAKWWGSGLPEKYGEALDALWNDYPDDVCMCWYQEPGYDLSPNKNPEYRLGYADYTNAARYSIGEAKILLPSWDELDQFLAHFPNPNESGNFDEVQKNARSANGRYKLGAWWRLFHERFWAIRGMENLMMDYYDNMEGLKAIGQRLVEFYKVIITKYAELGFDGIFSSDDLGHQTGPMMSPAVFEELYLPLYKEVISFTHENGMHFILHSCGDNTLLMDYLIEAGLDVFHPVQKGCMDMKETAEKFGDKISFLAGVDVQNSIINDTPQGVMEEISRTKGFFLRENGGLLLAMGNGIMPDTPFENIKAALDEMFRPIK